VKINKKNIESYLLSFGIHLILALIFFFFSFTIEPEENDYVTIGFGTVGKLSSPGPKSNDIVKDKKIVKKEKVKTNLKRTLKKVEIPKVKNSDESNKIIAAKPKKKIKKKPEEQKVKPLAKNKNTKSKGKDVSGAGEGNFGFEIDFGGKGKRKIYSYELPKYPEGVSKEVDVKLKFTILPDGTVGRIIPLIKADTRLELAAINSLRQWRFEPLPGSKKKAVQSAVIVFPFRLQ